MDQPEVTESIVSPPWITENHESDASLIQSILDGGERAQLSDTLTAVLTGGVSGDWFPYRYKADLAGDLIIKEEAALRLDTGDSVTIQWRYGWANTPTCQVCTADEVLWTNGWNVWTDAAPERGIVIFRSNHPALPLAVEIWFFPDPIQWPEALTEFEPILVTTLADAEEVTAAILESILKAVPAPP